jgi:hypothetical protein
MKKIVFFIAASLVTSITIAQTAKDGIIPFDKNNSFSGVILEVPGYDIKTIQGALQSRFETTGGLKGANSGKFRAYFAQAFPDFGSQNYDIYTQVIETGKKKDKKTIINLLVSKGNKNFVTPASDPDVIANMKTFLNNFMSYLKDYDTGLKASEQQKNIATLEKEQKTLNADKEKLQKQLEKKNTEIQQKQDELNKAKELLNTLQPSN